MTDRRFPVIDFSAPQRARLWLACFAAVVTAPNVVSFVRIPGPLQLARVLFVAIAVAILVWVLRLRPRTYLLIFSPLFVLEYADMMHLLEYGRHLSVGAFASVFFSDTKEAAEFLWQNISSAIGVWVGLTAPILLLAIFSPTTITKPQKGSFFAVFGAGLALATLFDIRDSFPVYPIIQAARFYQVQKQFAEEVDKRRGVKPSIILNNSEADALFILVLGETASRSHMHAYGYPRDTTPWLSSDPRLILFADASAPANLTQNSVPLLLTSATARMAASFYDSPSILQIANAAGFATYWLSNQSKFSFNENKVSVLAAEAQTRIFRNTGTVSIKDEVLLPDLSNVLKNGPSKKQFIVMHLLGSHAEYKQRYDSRFEVFRDRPPGVLVKDRGVWERINSYDNSIRYTDFVLGQIVALVEKQKRPSCVMYVSDHGEYLATAKPISGHGFPRATRPEAEIPLTLYCTAEYWERHPKRRKEILENRAKPVAAEDVFYAMADLLDIEFEGMAFDRSFVSPRYLPPLRRWIMNGEELLDDVARLEQEPFFQ